MDYIAVDLDQQEKIIRPKSHEGMTKKERKREKDFRKNRQHARGRGWQGSSE